jgi:hypothetical protein
MVSSQWWYWYWWRRKNICLSLLTYAYEDVGNKVIVSRTDLPISSDFFHSSTIKLSRLGVEAQHCQKKKKRSKLFHLFLLCCL